MSIAEKLTTIAENQQRVFDAGRNSGGGGGDYDSGYNDGYFSGYDSGFNEGYDSGYWGGYDEGHSMGYDEGQTAEYDRFWDSFQQNGNRTDYTYGFAGAWDRTTFRPKYDMHATTYNCCFHQFNYYDQNWESFDMVEYLENIGVELDTTKATNFSSMFMWAWVGRLGVIDCRAASWSLTTAFAYGKIKTIDKLIVKPENTFNNTFINNTELTNITFEGTIGDSISFQWQTKLSKASIESVITHLSTTTSGKTATFSKTAVTNAFGSTTASAWTTLVNSKSNWTISLV